MKFDIKKQNKFFTNNTTIAAAITAPVLRIMGVNKINPYDRVIIGSAIGITTMLYGYNDIGAGIGIGAFLQAYEGTAKLIVNNYDGIVYGISEHGKLLKIKPKQQYLKGLDGLALANRNNVYKLINNAYYQINKYGVIKLSGGLFQSIPHNLRNAGYKTKQFCINQKIKGNPAWLKLYNAANY